MSPFEQLAAKLGAHVAERNKTYGNSFAKTGDYLALLYPNGIAKEQMVDALLLARIFDKCMRVAQGHKTDSYEDIAGYGIIGAVNATVDEDYVTVGDGYGGVEKLTIADFQQRVSGY
jgi:hypothetical protein